jgi:hypothetical protein
MPPHPHVNRWHTREEGQPTPGVGCTLSPSLPHPDLIEAATTKLDATARYEEWEEVDSHTSCVMHGKDVQHDIIFGESVVVRDRHCTVKDERSSHYGALGWTSRATGEDHNPRCVLLQSTIGRDQDL